MLVECPKCKNRCVVLQNLLAVDSSWLLIDALPVRHLIADHLGWFKDTEGTNGGQFKTVEDLVRAKGEAVKRGRLDVGGTIEYVE